MLKKTIKKSASKKHRIPPKKRPKKFLAPEDKRNKLIQAKTTAKQKAAVKAKAESLGMTESDYIAAIVFGYEPKEPLTPMQAEMLKELPGIRSDLTNVANSLASLSPDEKLTHFRNFEFMHEWLRLVDLERENIHQFIKRFTEANHFTIPDNRKPITPPAAT